MCSKNKPVLTNPSMMGWICSKCGASNSPYRPTCPCSTAPLDITWGAYNTCVTDTPKTSQGTYINDGQGDLFNLSGR